jgi:creatinine amidohydrolase
MMNASIFDGTMSQMTWVEIEKAGQEGKIVLWPISVLEEHGPQLSIAVDIYLSCCLARLVQKQLLEKNIDSIIAPPNYWGINNVTAAFPGSFSLRKETFKALLCDILGSLKRWGFERVYLIDLHGDINHREALINGIRDARVACGTRAMGIVPRRITNKVGLSGKEDYLLFIEDDANPIPFTAFTKTQDMHAGSLETSFMQRFHPSEVNLEIAKDLKPTIFESKDWKGWANGWSDARKVIPYGYNGDPATLNPQLAEEYMVAEAASITQVILSSL